MDELSRGRINIDAVMRLTETSKNAIDHWKKLPTWWFKMQP